MRVSASRFEPRSSCSSEASRRAGWWLGGTFGVSKLAEGVPTNAATPHPAGCSVDWDTVCKFQRCSVNVPGEKTHESGAGEVAETQNDLINGEIYMYRNMVEHTRRTQHTKTATWPLPRAPVQRGETARLCDLSKLPPKPCSCPPRCLHLVRVVCRARPNMSTVGKEDWGAKRIGHTPLPQHISRFSCGPESCASGHSGMV